MNEKSKLEDEVLSMVNFFLQLLENELLSFTPAQATIVTKAISQAQNIVLASMAPGNTEILENLTTIHSGLKKAITLRARNKQFLEYHTNGGTMTMDEWEKDGRFDLSQYTPDFFTNQQ